MASLLGTANTTLSSTAFRTRPKTTLAHYSKAMNSLARLEMSWIVSLRRRIEARKRGALHTGLSSRARPRPPHSRPSPNAVFRAQEGLTLGRACSISHEWSSAANAGRNGRATRPSTSPPATAARAAAARLSARSAGTLGRSTAARSGLLAAAAGHGHFDLQSAQRRGLRLHRLRQTDRQPRPRRPFAKTEPLPALRIDTSGAELRRGADARGAKRAR